MEKTTAQTIQDAFLNSARREKVTVVFHIILFDTLSVLIICFYKFSVMLDVGGQDVLVFKHSISTIAQEKRTD